jgi:hypothetical protein
MKKQILKATEFTVGGHVLGIADAQVEAILSVGRQSEAMRELYELSMEIAEPGNRFEVLSNPGVASSFQIESVTANTRR